MESKLRTGTGFDAHPLAAGGRLVLGGVEIPSEKGAEGWSDADVLCHAVIDALLGAAALGDIGTHFPPGDPEYRDISSLRLLAKVRKLLEAGRWSVVNVDATVLLEQPRLREYIGEMRGNLARTLGVAVDSVSVKASTANGLGSIGRSEGIAAQAAVLIEGLS